METRKPFDIVVDPDPPVFITQIAPFQEPAHADPPFTVLMTRGIPAILPVFPCLRPMIGAKVGQQQ